MLCPACQAQIPAGSSFCPRCGQRVDGGSAAAPAASPAQMFAPRGAAAVEPERDLWSGGYSPKAMLGWWIIEGLLIAAGIAVAVLVPNPIALIAAAVIAGGFGLWLLLDLAIKRLSVHYKLTTDQLTHQTGLFTRVTNRVETIDIDDVTMQQSIIERMVGVGTLLVLSSDKSHPKLLLKGIDNVDRVCKLIDTAARDQRKKRGAYIESV
jgi:uncharacterized membrane protein YdbT with pleckstrin-like domain